MNPVLISLSSFGSSEVKRHGHLLFARLALQARADGFEVRSELLRNAEAELAALGEALPSALRVYSSHEGLWDTEGGLNEAALDRGLTHLRTLGSSKLKMSIRRYQSSSSQTLNQLRTALLGANIELVIENDQTPGAGTLVPLQEFFAAADSAGVKLGLTFDIGNWHWTGECPLKAAAVLAPRVCCVHCKGVQRRAQRWFAVPVVGSAAPWRAILRTQPVNQPWAIEYPLAGENLLAVTRHELAQLRGIARSLE
ncbi:MAG: glutamine ABC transporter ATP-binding protein [Polaromonas sp.]